MHNHVGLILICTVKASGVGNTSTVFRCHKMTSGIKRGGSNDE